MLTIKEVKDIINNLPDDTPIFVDGPICLLQLSNMTVVEISKVIRKNDFGTKITRYDESRYFTEKKEGREVVPIGKGIVFY